MRKVQRNLRRTVASGNLH